MRIIRKEIVIDAPVAKVWEHITNPAKIAGWLMPNNFEPSPGLAFTMDCDEEGKIACVVQEVIPPTKLIYSFTPPHLEVATIVSITLAPEKDRTRLTLVHSGWDALPPSEVGIADAFENGWGAKLEALQAQVTAEARG